MVYSQFGAITGRQDASYNVQPSLGPTSDLEGSVKFSWVTPDTNYALMEYRIGIVNKPGFYVFTADLEFRLNDDYAEWDYSEPWTFELKTAEAIQVLGNFVLRSFSVSGNIARMLCDVAVRTTAAVAPEFRFGFRSGVKKAAAHAWLGFRFESFFVQLIPRGVIPQISRRPRIKRPPKRTG